MHNKTPSMFGIINDELDCILAVSGTDAEFYCNDKTLREEALIDESSNDIEDESYYDEENDDATNIVDIAAENYRMTRDSGWEAFIDNDIDDIIIDQIDDGEVEDDDGYEFDDAWPDDFDCTLPSSSSFDNTIN